MARAWDACMVGYCAIKLFCYGIANWNIANTVTKHFIIKSLQVLVHKSQIAIRFS